MHFMDWWRMDGWVMTLALLTPSSIDNKVYFSNRSINMAMTSRIAGETVTFM